MIMNAVIAAAQAAGDQVRIVDAIHCYSDGTAALGQRQNFITHTDIGVLPKQAYFFQNGEATGTVENTFSFMGWDGTNWWGIAVGSGVYFTYGSITKTASGTKYIFSVQTSLANWAHWKNNMPMKVILIY